MKNTQAQKNKKKKKGYQATVLENCAEAVVVKGNIPRVVTGYKGVEVKKIINN